MINNTKQRIVVLGAAGFIGFHLSKKLIETGNYTLILIDNLVRGVLDSEFKSVINSRYVQFLELDLSNEISYKNLFLENDIVVNCAALNGTQNFYKNPVNVVRHSAVSAIFAAENAARAKVKKYIYFGTPESYAGGVNLDLVEIPTPENSPLVIDNPLNLRWSYAASKTVGEIAAIANHFEFGLPIFIFRVHNIYGPRMGQFHVVPDLIEKFTKGDFRVNGLNESRSFMYIDDLIFILEKFIFQIDSQNDIIFNVGSKTETPISELAKNILQILGFSNELVSAPKFPGSVNRRIADTTLLAKYVQIPETSLEVGLRSYIDWYQRIKND